MPKRNDIRKVLVIGSGPIVIGQAVELDYSGTQAIKALRDEGVEVVLLNSNPATVMTDPEFAHRAYIETVKAAAKILEAERPDSLLPTMGGQTALNLAKALAEQGIQYQRLREASLAIIREIGVDMGGSNIQFGVNPKDGRIVVIEMNPRVSRSSALASKATGYPIAKIAAKPALGYTLDELRNDITRDTPASFEPTID